MYFDSLYRAQNGQSPERLDLFLTQLRHIVLLLDVILVVAEGKKIDQLLVLRLDGMHLSASRCTFG